ncbi:permease [Microbacterium cremeum]|uniref:permease n=1 Tax=Microbacterium cremeum TaxID=2782169 RepID=UPI0018885928|nr:permease [Microbacterium cremeum]
MARHRRPAATLSPSSRERVAATRVTAAERTAVERARRPQLRRRRLWAGALLTVVLIGTALVTHSFTAVPLPDRLQDGLTLAVSVLVESLPFVMLGVLLAVVIEVWVPPGAIERWLPRPAWARRAVLSLLGMLVPVCECGNVPFARGMLMRGFSVPETLTFLMAAPIVNPIVILTTHQAFGFSDGILVARLAGGYAIANLIGWLYSRHPDPKSLLTPRFAQTCATPPTQGRDGRGRRSVTQLLAELRAVMSALVIGSALAGAIQVLVPRDVLIAIGSDPVLSILAMAALAVVVAICSNVDAFFALSFASTFTPGSIVAFLLIGPLVDVKMLALLRTTFTSRLLVGLVAIVVASAFLIGAVVNVVG